MLYFFFGVVYLGIQRPLEDISNLTESIYIPKGINTPALDRSLKWEFEPYGNMKVGRYWHWND